MILARCPHCDTTFRAAPEALKLRAGKVRCGKCHEVFNALDNLVREAILTANASQPSPTPQFTAPAFVLTPPPAAPTESAKRPDDGQAPIKESFFPAAADDSAPEMTDSLRSPDLSDKTEDHTATDSESEPEAEFRPDSETDDQSGSPPESPFVSQSESQVADHTIEDIVAIVAFSEPPSEGASADFAEPDPGNESIEIAPTKAAPANPEVAPDIASETVEKPVEPLDPLFEPASSAQVAIRDTREAAGYSKWAEGTLSAPSIAFEEPRRTAWMSVVLVVTLTLMLLIQITHYWRIDIAKRWPTTRPWLEEACASFDCAVPYPRDVSLINLEASELQIDPARGNMLVLNMTIKNRAPFEQQFPAVELTLTDARDDVVVRRILSPEEWLPESEPQSSKTGEISAGPRSIPSAFPANKEIAARLWIDAKDTGAVGYRLFVFYP